MTNLNSKIEWCDATWSPTLGCDKVSKGCDACYAIRTVTRSAANPNPKVADSAAGLTHNSGNGLDWTGRVNLLPQRLNDPLRWRKPRRVFVDSQSDLFHKDVPDEFIARVWAVMAATPQHTYQILTKRHGRMRSLLSSPEFRVEVNSRHGWILDPDGMDLVPDREWPLCNVWCGVSVEDQRTAELRIPALVDTCLAVRFLSLEPLLGPVDLAPWFDTPLVCGCGGEPGGPAAGCSSSCMQHEPPGLHWCIVGGESGPGARRCDPAWIRHIASQCREAGTPMFVKQLGSVWGRENGWGGKGGLPEQWPEDLRVREFPAVVTR